MSEFAPTLIETEAPHEQTEAAIIDFPTPSDESKRFDDVDFAHKAAIEEDIRRDAIIDARTLVEQALAQKSPLVDKYKAKLTHAEVSLVVNDKATGKFYDHFYRPAPTKEASSKTDDLRVAA